MEKGSDAERRADLRAEDFAVIRAEMICRNRADAHAVVRADTAQKIGAKCGKNVTLGLKLYYDDTIMVL